MVAFNQDFDRGNLDIANTSVVNEASSTPTITITPRDQTTGAQTHWAVYYFEVSEVNGKTPRFEVNDPSSPAFYVSYNSMFSYDGGATWTPFDVVDGTADTPFFEHNSAFTQDTVLIAHGFVYPLGNVAPFFSGLDQTHIHEPPSSTGSNTITTLSDQTDDDGRTISGQPMYAYLVTDTGQSPDDGLGKRNVIVDSGLHAGEDRGNDGLEGFLEFLTSGDTKADTLRKNFRFIVYPLMNPMGRWGGHWRGQWDPADLTADPNRDFGNQDLESTQTLASAFESDLNPAPIYDPIVLFDFQTPISGGQHYYYTPNTQVSAFDTALANYTATALDQQGSSSGPSGSIRSYFSSGRFNRGIYITTEFGAGMSPADARTNGAAFGKALADMWDAGNVEPDYTDSDAVYLRSATVIAVESAGSNESGSFDAGLSAPDRCLFVAIAFEKSGGQDVTSVTYGGESLTLQQEVDANSSDEFSEIIQIWTLVDPPTGSNTLATDSAGSGTDFAMMAAVFANVDQSTPVGNATTESWLAGSGNDGIVDITVDDGDAAFWLIVQDRNPVGDFTAATDNDKTRVAELGDSTSGMSTAMGHRVVGSGTYSVGASPDNDQDGAIIALEVNTSVSADTSVSVGISSEVSEAFSVAGTKVGIAGQANSAETALSISFAKGHSVGQAVESDIGLAVDWSRTFIVGQASETDIGQAVNTGGTSISVGQSEELDSGLSATHSRIYPVGLALESDDALARSGAESDESTLWFAGQKLIRNLVRPVDSDYK